MTSHMTQKEFLQALSELKLKWEVWPCNAIRGRDRKNNFYCPITAVAKKRTGKMYETYFSDLAARDIGLNAKNWLVIAGGVDGENKHMTPARWRIRRKMLRILNLVENSQS